MSLAPEWELNLGSEDITQIDYVEDANALIIPTDDSEISVYNSDDGSERGRLSPTNRVYGNVSDDDLLLAGGTDDRVYAFDPWDLSQLWDAPGAEVGERTSDQIFLIGGRNIWAHTLTTGDRQWQYTLPENFKADFHKSDSVNDVQGKLLVEVARPKEEEDFGVEMYGVVGIDKETGNEEWYYASEGLKDTIVKPSGTYVFKTVNGQTTLSRINIMTGYEQWNYNDANIHDSSYCRSFEEDCIYLWDWDRYNLIALDPTTGSEKWRTNGDWHDIEGHWVEDDTIYVNWENDQYKDHIVAAVEKQSGRIQWQRDIADQVKELTNSKNKVFVSTKTYNTDRGRIYCINAATGSINWEFDINDTSFRILSADSNPVIITDYHKLFAVDKTTGESVWSFARDYMGQVTEEFVVCYADDDLFILDRNDGTVAARVREYNRSLECEQAIFVSESGKVWVYALVNNSHIFQSVDGSGEQEDTANDVSAPEGTDTAVYESSDGKSEENDTKIFNTDSSASEFELKFCPGCGESLAEFDDVTFCPSCGSDLSSIKY